MNEVPRIFDLSFTGFNLILCSMWISFLLARKHYRAFVFGLFGFTVYFMVDDIIWYHILGTRVFLTMPKWLSPDVFEIYFSFTYAMLQFSIASIFFDYKISMKEKIVWASSLFTGWLFIAVLSKIFRTGETLSFYRQMGSQRLIQLLMVTLEYLSLVLLIYLCKLLKLNWTKIGFIFLAGFYIHFCMESTLFISGIRQGKWDVLIFNSLFEFNTGAPILYILNNLPCLYRVPKATP
jgi:hypothetical protein